MKKIITALCFVAVGLSLQSCLHDNEDYFDGKSAAERIDETVASDKQLLESAPNGWKLLYYTGEEYTGGGYTYLCKFKAGKAYVSGDMAQKADSVCKSSYDIIKDQGPVLTFDTYNDLMHKFATPTSGSIDGEQGDYEFIIQKTTNDSIYLQGKKWGNKMVMVRMPNELSWEEHLDSINKVATEIYYNNKVMNGNDSIAYISIDDVTRRAILTYGNEQTDVSYYVTSKGIHLQHPINLMGKEVSDLTYNHDTNELDIPNENNLKIQGYLPPNYEFIDYWVGAWTLQCYARGENNKKTETLEEYRVELEQYDRTYLKAQINIDGQPYKSVYFRYYRDSGTIALVQQYLEDPSKQYSLIMVAPLSFANDGRFNWTGRLLGYRSDEDADVVKFKWDGVGAAPTDSYVLIAVTSSGQPVYENGQLISVGELTYLESMKRAGTN